MMAARRFVASFGARDDDDVRNLIDEATWLAYSSGKHRIFEFEGQIQDAVEVDHGPFKGQDLIAVVAKNRIESSPFELAIVAMMTRSYLTKLDGEQKVGAGALRDQLAKLQPEPPAARTKSMPSKATAKPPAAGSQVEIWLVSYPDPDGEGEEVVDRVAAADVQGYVAKLVDRGILADKIEVWKPVKKTTKVIVEFDI